MKILKLRFKNLNSLYGEWNIDFTNPEYVASGIFAITGPTGAGKSTVLDAICLALYGSTPRLGKITRDNEIMSRCTGECFSEVTFQSQQGTFICHWEQHRARKKKDGKLSEAKHEISDAITEKVLESKKRNVADAIEARTGMDFDRFTRSILLAQGGFDTFLKADADHRSPILEQITGTEIYSEISKKIHERKRDEAQKLASLNAESMVISTLSDEDRLELTEEISIKEKLGTELSVQSRETAEAIKWITDIDDLREEISLLQSEERDLLQDTEAFKPDRQKLNLALKAVDLDGDYASLQSLRKSQSTDMELLNTASEKLPTAEASLIEREQKLEKAEQDLEKARERHKKEAPLIRKIQLLDHTLSQMKTAIDRGELDCDKLDRQIEEKTVEVEKLEEKLNDTRRELEQIQSYLIENACYEVLSDQLTGIEEQLKNLQSSYEDLAELKNLFQKSNQNMLDCKEKKALKLDLFEKSKADLETARNKTGESRKTLENLLDGQLMREYRAKRDSLMRELTLVRKIEQLEEEREKLEDGKACPLCGSLTHPFAEGNLPEKGTVERDIDKLEKLIDRAEKIEATIRDLEAEEKEKTSQLSMSEIELSKVKSTEDHAREETDRLHQELEKAEEKLKSLQNRIQISLKPLGITTIEEKNIQTVLEDLREKLNYWKEKDTGRTACLEKIRELTSSIKNTGSVIDSIRANSQDRHSTLEREKEKYATTQQERQKLYGSKEPDEEERKILQKITELEKLEKTESQRKEETYRELEVIKSRIASLEETIDIRATELETSEASFRSVLEKADFSDETAFTSCRLSQEERATLTEKAEKLDRRKSELLIRKKDKEAALAEKESQKKDEDSLENLQRHEKTLQARLKETEQELGAIKQRLLEDKKARAQISEKRKEIENQSSECERWEKLHKLIGSSDGKLYRNFAQGITFELMVSHANRQLIKMTDRYLLKRDEEENLELNVVDNYQAGETRSTRNLSGGESFIVSLALALGLSQMASRKVRVDSLFLDEGFGTLDEDSLDTALETLANLQHDGKLIGVISHVAALKERIPTQIEIKPSNGGKSLIKGPGCSKN